MCTKSLFRTITSSAVPKPNRKVSLVLAFGVFASFLVSNKGLASSVTNWPQFRGPMASGVSDDPAPTTWDIKSGKNILWQTPIPGLGHACPIIWQDHIYVATAVKPGAKADLRVGLYGDIGSYKENEKHQWQLLCLDKRTGKVLWEKTPIETVPRVQRHTKASHCNSTPATDGQRIVAILGSEGIFCFDMDGRELWRKDLGPMDPGFYAVPNTSWGFASSPVLHDGKIVVQCDVDSEQYLALFDLKDGHQIWRTKREDVASWCTPIVSVTPKRSQIIVNGWKEIGGYDLATGKSLWQLKGGGDIPVSSPVLADDVVILTSGHGRLRPIRAVRLDATGKIKADDEGEPDPALVWSHPRQGNYLETPIVIGEFVWGNLDGVVTCFDLHTGVIQYHDRIGGGTEGFTASPVAAGGKLYWTGEQGNVYVVNATNTLDIVATNKLGGICLATPAISEGKLYFRTVENLIAIGPKK